MEDLALPDFAFWNASGAFGMCAGQELPAGERLDCLQDGK